MPKVDYDQIARFEAASELLTVFMGMCRNLKKKYPEYVEDLENKRYEAILVKQNLRIENDKLLKEIEDNYGPVVREYYKSPKDFKLTQSFFNIKIKA